MSFFDRMAERNDRKFFGGQASKPSDASTDKNASLLTCLDGKPDWAGGSDRGTSGGGSGSNPIEAFDRHAIIYIFLICLVIMLIIAPVYGRPGITFGDIVGCAFLACIVVSMFYYFFKGTSITTGTYMDWKKTHPGESIWDIDSGLTSYDQNFADAIGRAAAAGRHSGPNNLTSYDKAMAHEIARNMKGGKSHGKP